jgi:hypothetical protein
MNNICKLCLKSKQLKRSHIFPRAFYKQVKESGKYIFLKTNGESGTGQSDWWEHLFCEDCEKIFSGFESKAIPIFKEINKISSESEYHTIKYEMSEEQYKYFELFKLSILYRLLLVNNIFTNYYIGMIFLMGFIKNKEVMNIKIKSNKPEDYVQKIHAQIMYELRKILLNKRMPEKQYWNIKLKKMYDWDNKINIENIIGTPHFNKSPELEDERMVFVLDGIIIESNMNMYSFFKPMKKTLNMKIPKVSLKYFEQLPFMAYSYENKNK